MGTGSVFTNTSRSADLLCCCAQPLLGILSLRYGRTMTSIRLALANRWFSEKSRNSGAVQGNPRQRSGATAILLTSA